MPDADEYLQRARDLDEAASPTRTLLRQSLTFEGEEAGGEGEAEGGTPKKIDARAMVREILFGLQPTAESELQAIKRGEVEISPTPAGLESAAEGAKQMPPPKGAQPLETDPVALAELREPAVRRGVNRVLRAMFGVSLDELQRSIERGTLPELMNLRMTDPFGGAAEDMARDLALRNGTPAEFVEQVATVTGVLAGALFPPGAGPARKALEKAAKKGAEPIADVSMMERLKTMIGPKKRLVRLEEVTVEEARRVAGLVDEEGAVYLGRKRLKMDWGNVDPNDPEGLSAVVNRLAEAFDKQTISDPELIAKAKAQGVDLADILAGPKTVQGQLSARVLASEMALGAVGQRIMSLRDSIKRLPPNVTARMEEELVHVAEIGMALADHSESAISEYARALRARQLKVPGAEVPRRMAEILHLQRGGVNIRGMSGRELMAYTEGLTRPEQMATWLKVVRGLTGAFVGAGLGAEVGEGAAGDVGMVAGAVGGAAFGAAAGINPRVLLEAWINGLLSGPQTYTVNLASNVASTVNGVVERGIAATHGSAGLGDRVVPGEALVMMHAGMSFLMDSLRVYYKSLALEAGRTAGRAAAGGAAGALMSSDLEDVPGNVLAGALVGAHLRGKSFLINDREIAQRALSAEGLQLSGALGRAADVMGSIMRMPTRGLVKTDDWVKAWNAHMEIAAQAHRRAILRGLDPASDEYAQAVARGLREPTRDVLDRAGDYASYIAFQSETNAAIAGLGTAHPLWRVLMPFYRTPANILKWAYERMPGVAFIAGAYRADMKSGGARAQLAQAKIDMGLSMAGLAWYLAHAGVLTGSGSGNRQLARLEREAGGRQENSVAIPGTDFTVSINRADPWGLFLGTIADIHEISHELPEATAAQLVGAAILAFSDQFLDKSFISGAGEFFDAMVEARENRNFRPLEKWASRQAATFAVPRGVATLSRAMNPAQYEVSGVIDTIKSELQGFATDDEMPIRRDFFYQPYLRPSVGNAVLDAINSFYVREQTDDPKIKSILAELRRNRIGITDVSRLLGGPRQASPLDPEPTEFPGISLSNKDYDLLKRIFATQVTEKGLTLKDALYDLIKSPEYHAGGPATDGPQGGKARQIKALVNRFKRMAQEEFLNRRPALRLQLEEMREQRIENLIGTPPGAAPRRRPPSGGFNLTR